MHGRWSLGRDVYSTSQLHSLYIFYLSSNFHISHRALGVSSTTCISDQISSNIQSARGMIFASHYQSELVKGRGFNSHSVHLFVRVSFWFLGFLAVEGVGRNDRRVLLHHLFLFCHRCNLVEVIHSQHRLSIYLDVPQLYPTDSTSPHQPKNNPPYPLRSPPDPLRPLPNKQPPHPLLLHPPPSPSLPSCLLNPLKPLRPSRTHPTTAATKTTTSCVNEDTRMGRREDGVATLGWAVSYVITISYLRCSVRTASRPRCLTGLASWACVSTCGTCCSLEGCGTWACHAVSLSCSKTGPLVASYI